MPYTLRYDGDLSSTRKATGIYRLQWAPARVRPICESDLSGGHPYLHSLDLQNLLISRQSVHPSRNTEKHVPESGVSRSRQHHHSATLPLFFRRSPFAIRRSPFAIRHSLTPRETSNARSFSFASFYSSFCFSSASSSPFILPRTPPSLFLLFLFLCLLLLLLLLFLCLSPLPPPPPRYICTGPFLASFVRTSQTTHPPLRPFGLCTGEKKVSAKLSSFKAAVDRQD
ncbi:unnamed protein product, partial [Protopolystoma xenopodis]